MDEIQRKLALIDEQLAGRTLPKRLASTAPLFLPAVGLMAGILLQSRLADRPTGSVESMLPWIWLAAAAPAGTVLFAGWTRSRLRPEGFAFIASFCFLCLGAIRLLAFETAAPSDIRHFVGDERVLATIRGRILTQPYQQPQNWCFARFASGDPATAFYLEMEAVEPPATGGQSRARFASVWTSLPPTWKSATASRLIAGSTDTRSRPIRANSTSPSTSA